MTGAEPSHWSDLARETPDLARAVRRRLEASRHHVLATLRADGSPRVSGTEVQFHGDDLVAGMMSGSVKSRDLSRDGRFALHANPGEGDMADGDAKISGTAVRITDPAELASYVADLGEGPPPSDMVVFRLLLADAVLTSIHPDGDRLVIETWRPGRPLLVVERR